MLSCGPSKMKFSCTGEMPALQDENELCKMKFSYARWKWVLQHFQKLLIFKNALRLQCLTLDIFLDRTLQNLQLSAICKGFHPKSNFSSWEITSANLHVISCHINLKYNGKMTKFKKRLLTPNLGIQYLCQQRLSNMQMSIICKIFHWETQKSFGDTAFQNVCNCPFKYMGSKIDLSSMASPDASS